MHAVRHDDRKHHDSGFLKTTTWGALIALSLVLLVLGSTGHLSRFVEGPAALRADAGSSSPDSSVASEFAKPTNAAGTLISPSGPTGLHPFFASRENHSVSAPNVSATRTSSGLQAPAIPGGGQDPAAKPASESVLPFGSLEDRPAQIASRIAPDLKGLDPETSIDVIVQFKKSALSPDLTTEGATHKTDLPVVNAQLVSVSAGSLNNIASRSDVVYISPNRQVRGATDSVIAEAVNADIANANGWDGTGIGVAVIDSGVTGVLDLTDDENTSVSRVVYTQSFVPGNGNGNDDFGHGTHVAGIIAGNGYISNRLQYYPGYYQGIAPEATIINLRVLDQNGSGTDSNVIAAIQQAIALQSTYNIRVINLSLSRGVYESYTLDPLCQAVESAWNAGIVVVAAAGNMGEYNGAGTNGYATIGAPGNDPYVITVSAPTPTVRALNRRKP